MLCDICMKRGIFVILTCFFIRISCFSELSSTNKITTSPIGTTEGVNSSSTPTRSLNDIETPRSTSPTVENSPTPSNSTSYTLSSSLSTSVYISFTLQHQEYNIKVYSDQLGVIEMFETIPKLSDIKYELLYDENTDIKLGNKLHIDAEIGVLRIKQTINPGEYVITIKASLVHKSSANSTAKVKLKVLEAVCTESHKPMFLNSFLKTHVTENKADVILPEKPKTKCEYSSMNQKPSGDFFKLNSETGELESKDKIDRESEIFRNQVQAHISLEIQIKCSSETKKYSHEYKYLKHPVVNIQSNRMQHLFQTENPPEQLQTMVVNNIPHHRLTNFQVAKDNYHPTTSTSDNEEEVFPKNSKQHEHHCSDAYEKMTQCDSIVEDQIIYNTHIMKLLIIIDDANDNYPEFSENVYFFGFPDKTLVSKILPKSLGRVYAMDKDLGLNAAIKYSIENTPEIIIDPCTGIIYPNYAQFKYEQMKFKVTATDRNGKPDGLSKSVLAKLDILRGLHIMKMLVQRSLEQKNEEIIMSMQKYLNISVKVLKIDTVASIEEISGSIEIKNGVYHILEYYMIYAHKGQTLVDMNTVEKELKRSKELSESILWTSVLSASPHNPAQSKSFFSAMVVVILILCIGCMAFYMLYIRTGNYFKCFNYIKENYSSKAHKSKEESISTSDYVVSFAKMHHMNPTFNYMETDTSENLTPITPKAYEMANTQIMDDQWLTPPILVNSNSRRNSFGVEDSLGETRVRRKSTVSFNEIVEQYHS